MIKHNPALAGHIAFWSLISFTLFLIVPAFAQPDSLEWKITPGYAPDKPILFIWGVITFATVTRLYAALYKRKSNLDPQDLAAMPAEGTNLGSKIWNYIGALTSNKEMQLEELRELLTKPNRLTHDTPYNLSPGQKEDVTRILGQILLRFEEIETLHEGHLETIHDVTEKLRDLMALPDEETLENMLQHTEELLKFAKGIRREFNQWFPDETNTTLEHVIKRFEDYFAQANQDADLVKTYQDRLNEIAMEMNFPPTSWVKTTKELFYDYLSPLSAVFETPPTTLSPRIILLRIQDGVAAIAQEIPDKYKERDDNGTLLIPRSIAGLRNAVHRMTAGMSGIQPTGDQQTMTLRQIWNEVPAGMRPLGGNCPTNLNDFHTWLNSLSRPVVPAQPQGCNHPAELATELGDPIAQPWNTSLTHVRQLVNQPPAGNPPPGGPPPPAPRPDPAPAAGNQEPLFRTSDIPKFGDEDDYWTYRRSMTIFCEATTVSPVQLPTAMARIIASFSGERRKTAMAFDLTEIYHATWEETWPALLQYMDNHFLDRNAWLQQYNHWIGLRYSDHKWGREFVSLYIREHATLNQIAAVQNKRAIPDAEAVQKLVDRVPRRVNEQLRHEHRDWQALANQRQIYEWIIEEWEHAKNLGLLEKAPKKDHPAPARNMNVPVNAPGNTGQPRINWPDLVCDKPCFDTNPPVHPSLRGPWRDLKPEQQRGLHSRCRRPISEHGKGIKGCPQAGQHLFHKGTNTDPAPQNRQITQGNNEDLQVTPFAPTVRFAENSGNE
jgi:hypothetical protein